MKLGRVEPQRREKKSIVGKKVQKRRKKYLVILNLMKDNKKITIPEIVKVIGITERSVERNIEKLKDENKLKRIGDNRNGHWELPKNS